MTSSASGTPASARITVSKPLRGTSRPTHSTRGRSPRAATGPSGRNCSTSTPDGTTVIRLRAAPSRISSPTSSVQVATTRSTSRASARSSRIRTGGLVSSRPWNRRLVTPSAWKVCTTGRSRSRVADSAASPDIQKCACTTSGGSAANRAASSEPSWPTSGSSSSFGTGAAGPASRCSTSTPSSVRTRSGSSAESRRVWTVTSWPARASARASDSTWTFWPPASTPPTAASGLACSDTMAILIGSPP